ncbi:Insertion element protein [Actinomadura sp. WAC 06369]|uniref:Insertion element protein n=1 Tax=Actinomadura sp. WAC 06369 TaxID=2203193 RepID=UPI000F769D84|nr:Insertion element protein [Actinomadura sp. WAC 06369]RSN51206.1 Insertion element protein [Actinomadura sp. WAC 06369]
MSERMAPFYCPYCGEENLEPRADAGSWFCPDCVRSFTLKFLGVGAPGATGAPRTTKENSR